MSKNLLAGLSPKEKKALLEQAKKELAAEEQKMKAVRGKYKENVEKVLPKLFTTLQRASQQLATAKKEVYTRLSGLVDEKSKAYGREADQGSHTFTNADGLSITIGYRQNDGWDDTVTVGIQKVTDFLQSLGKDDDSKTLVKGVMQLLAKDKAGNLKASRVLQLKKMAEDTGRKDFIDAIQIIQDAYRPARSKQFVTCKYKDADGTSIELPLSISDALIS